jgi:NDP-sugar pyrophosphorylase family protein
LQAIILASGRGTRFWPITEAFPKALLPLANRPLLEYLISALAKVNCTEIFVTLGYAGDQLREFLTTSQVSSLVKPVLAPDWAQGPLASFQAVIPHLSAQKPCILVPTDLYVSPANLRLLASPAVGMALLFDAKKHQPGTLIHLDSSEQILDLSQSQTSLPDYYPAVPALRATPEFLSFSLKARSKAHLTVFSLLREWLRQGNMIQGLPLVEKGWCDVDTPDHLVRLNHHLLSEGWPPDPLPPGTYLPEGISMEGPLRSATLAIGKHSQILGPVLLGLRVQVGENCIISDGTTLGASTTVHANSKLARCITFPYTHVPSNVDLKASVLDAKGNILHSQ